MPNKLYNDLADKGGGKAEGGAQGGSAQSTAMPIRTADWPGLPGGGGPDRSGGAPKDGYCGAPFNYSMSRFSPMKMGKHYGGKMEHEGKADMAMDNGMPEPAEMPMPAMRKKVK